mmetsp:Transcript_81130/g.234606  ORF Transcript_81130/g.234606 Transcript_81130/m.234606 type:complete len:97 (-) Transcript_81130:236-526(-)
MYNNLTVSGNMSHHIYRAVLAFGDCFKHLSIFRSNQESVVFLEFSTPYLKDRQSFISHLHLANIIDSTGRFHEFFQHVSVSTSSLVVYRNNWVLVT